MKSILSFILSISFLLVANIQEISAQKNSNYLLQEDIFCRATNEAEQDEYIAERCKLDIYYPEEIKNFTTVVWFHGGGISGGNKSIPEKLKNNGIAVFIKTLERSLTGSLKQYNNKKEEK